MPMLTADYSLIGSLSRFHVNSGEELYRDDGKENGNHYNGAT